MSAAPSQAEAAVPIPDAQFLNCLDRNLEPVKDAGESVTATELASILYLGCSSSEIADLTGAQYLTGAQQINVSSNKIADLSPLKELTGATVYANDQKWDLAIVVDHDTTVSIKGRSGAPITNLTKASDWDPLTIVGAQIHASAAGLVDLYFTDPQNCLVSADCTNPEYWFAGTVSVTASAEFTATPAPTITGTAAVGETLTAHPVDWTPLQLDWTYQWYRNDTEIAGATADTYQVTVDDAGWSLKVAVTGVSDVYASQSVSSLAVNVPGIAFTTTTRPEIEGTAKVGKILTAEVSGWAPTPASWTYQWKRNGGVIPGATQSSYALTGTDAGKTITVTVTGIKAGYKPTSQTSIATRKVSAGTFITVMPTITGTFQVGHTLTATAPGWSPTPDHWYYRWYRNNKPITGASKSSYTLVGSDFGKTITVRMTGLKTGYVTAARTYSRTVTRGQFTAPLPTITGTPEPGHTLKVVISGWSPTPSEVHRQWYRDGHRIPKATKSTYKLKTFDVGHNINVRVIGEKRGYSNVTKMSLALRITK
jgi:hypothetical protein